MNTSSDTHRTTRAAARGFVRAGSAAAPFLVVVWAVQALVRPGYDVTRHPMSLLALGDGGFVQTANFIITGLLVLALARGFQLLYTDGRGGRAIPVLVALMGIGLIAAGIFPADAGAGFPAGAPEGMPQYTPIGILHEASHAVVLVSYTVATVVLVMRFGHDHDRTMQWATIGVFVLVVALSAIPHQESFPIRVVIAGALPLASLAAVAHRELRKADSSTSPMHSTSTTAPSRRP